MLNIRAERRVEEDRQYQGYTRHEFRDGTMTRTLPSSEGIDESDIAAGYRDGILEVHVPIPQEAAAPASGTCAPRDCSGIPACSSLGRGRSGSS